jgi:hypothetical protein
VGFLAVSSLPTATSTRGAAEAGRELDIFYSPEPSVVFSDCKLLNVMHIYMQK